MSLVPMVLRGGSAVHLCREVRGVITSVCRISALTYGTWVKWENRTPADFKESPCLVCELMEERGIA